MAVDTDQRYYPKWGLERFARFPRLEQIGSLEAGYLIRTVAPDRAIKLLQALPASGLRRSAELCDGWIDEMKLLRSSEDRKRDQQAISLLPRNFQIGCTRCLPYIGESAHVAGQWLIVEQDREPVKPEAVFVSEIAYYDWLLPNSGLGDDLRRQAGFCLVARELDATIGCQEAVVFALNLHLWMELFVPGSEKSQFNDGLQAAIERSRSTALDTGTVECTPAVQDLFPDPLFQTGDILHKYRSLDLAACQYFDRSRTLANTAESLYRPVVPFNLKMCGLHWEGLGFGPRIAQNACKSANSFVSANLMDEKVVLLMQGRNADGKWVYTYLRVSLGRLEDLKSAMNNKKKDFDVEDYGEVLFNGFGAPTPELKQYVRIRWNMRDMEDPSLTLMEGQFSGQ